MNREELLKNAKRGYGWKVNPWVWVVELEKWMDNE